MENLQEIEVSRMRNAIAKKTSMAKSVIPHFYVSMEMCVDNLLKHRTAYNRQNGNPRLSINDYLVKAASHSISSNPEFMNSYHEGKMYCHQSVDVSIAVSLDEGLVTPVLKEVDKKTIAIVAKETKQLAEQARSGELNSASYFGGILTISNLGISGVSQFSAIISPGQNSILAVGTVFEKVVKKNGEFVVESRILITLSADHRSLDGVACANFLADCKTLIEDENSELYG